jgi:hypothetical protein
MFPSAIIGLGPHDRRDFPPHQLNAGQSINCPRLKPGKCFAIVQDQVMALKARNISAEYMGSTCQHLSRQRLSEPVF